MRKWYWLGVVSLCLILYQYYIIHNLKSTITTLQQAQELDTTIFINMIKEIDSLQNKINKNTPPKINHTTPHFHIIRNMKITYYSNDAISINVKKYRDGLTSIGLPVAEGIVAVDPNIIPYGTILYIPCLKGFYIAADTGSKIRGKHIDVYVGTREEAIRRGVDWCDVIVVGHIGSIRELVRYVRSKKRDCFTKR